MIGHSTDFAEKLTTWYRASRRDLPWRPPFSAPQGSRPDAYRVLLSELMLQQTQVATVVPYFHRFIARFPTVRDLAAAPEQDVLLAWQGLGYYSRARNLHRAAKAIVQQFAGEVPSTVDELRRLPGIGRYTAGAIASIAFGRPAPILDGNVMRVLCRVDAMRDDPRERRATERLWERAETLLPEDDVADYNSALMELGALVCTPRNPQCLLCPVREHCEALQQGIAQQIPPTRKPPARPVEHRCVLCIEQQGRWLITQRPATGRWASMWQFLTVEHPDAPMTAAIASGLSGRRIRSVTPLMTLSHTLTHRHYLFNVFRCRVSGRSRGTWIALEELAAYPLPRPHVRIATELRRLAQQSSPRSARPESR